MSFPPEAGTRTCMPFVHLHTHSHYSLLDALPQVDDLVKTAKKRGFTALALTDHANMYGTIEFYEKCEKEQIKPIIGVELYVSTVSRHDKTTPNQFADHLVVLALNDTGYRNLLKLVSFSHTEGLHGKPRVDKELLTQLHEGLVALSGCLEGEVSRILHKEQNYEKAKKIALEYQELFGKDFFYLELNDLPALLGQQEVNDQLITMSKETGIPLVVTRDSHYLDPEDAEAQDVLTCIRDGHHMDDTNRATMANIDYSLATEEEIAKRFKHVPEALENTQKIADRVVLKLELNKWNFAHVDLPPGKTVDEFLRDTVYEKLPALMEVTDKVRERADYELGIISKKGYSPYFLVVADYVQYARTHGIVETTRGSGAGSLVSYALGITTVNPLLFKLPFERFLNPFRPSPPDIDADFADDRRDDMIAYVIKKYGADKVAQIITFGTMMARGAVRDVGRALGYSYGFCDQVAKLIPFGAQGFQITIKKALDLEPELKELYNKNPQAKRLLDLAQKVEGCARHTSIHAAGVVIAPTPLTDFTPIQFETGGDKVTTQYEMHAVEAAGLLKMDFLGIRNLSILGHAVEIVEKTTGQKIDIYNLPWDNKKTYEMLARGETVGVFQLSGSGMTRYLKELKPTTIFDIMAMVALFRPGPMESIPDYIKRKHHPEQIEYLDPRMKDYLDQSLGLIVYQDDVLLTAINLGGYNWEEADKFRKAMGKKIPEEMMKQKEKFFKGCKEYGKVPQEKIEKLWHLIEPFAAYGFNKAHAASYGVVAYQTAYLKANFPIQYMTAILIAESGDIDKVPEIIHECERMGVKVLPPDINESFKNFAMIDAEPGVEAHIRFGLHGIKNLGDHIAEMIYRERKEGGKYKNVEEFLSRVQDKDLNKKSLESLIKCGAMDSFGYDRNLLLSNVDNMLAFHRQAHDVSASKQHSLFSGTSIDLVTKVRLDPAPLATETEKLNWEKELLGLYVTSHPFKYFQKIMESTLTMIKDLAGHARSTWVVVGGIIEHTKKKITRGGKAMMFVKIQDTTGGLELLVFPRTYETTKDVWVEGKKVCVIGKSGETEGDDKLFVEKAYEVTPDTVSGIIQQLNMGRSSNKQVAPASRMPDFNPPIKIEVKETSEGVELVLSAEELKNASFRLKALLAQHPGEELVYLKVGDKKIKTSFKVKKSDKLIEELQGSI
jgi:DNA polymerase-3 subunit alpha